MHELKKERTFVMIKPDGVQRSLIGEIIKRYERMGLKLTALKMFIPTEEQARQHYTVDPEWIRKTGEKAIAAYEKKGMEPPSREPEAVGERVLGNLQKYFASGPVIAMVWQGVHAVELIRKITGSTEPRTADVGTIRGDFVLDSYQMADTSGRAVRNLIHASTSAEEAEAEIAIWMDEKEIVEYRLIQEQILYDVNLDGILE